MNFKAIIFDLDGTLINSLADIADAMNRTLLRFNYPTYSYDEYNYFVGRGLKNLVYQCLPQDRRTDSHLAECHSFMVNEYRKAYAEKTLLYDGIPDLLNRLTTLHIHMSILSNKADELVQKICTKLLSSWHFDAILGATERFPLKPDPASALFLANAMCSPPSQCLYLGDTNIDMMTAHAAGMFAVGATWGFRTRNELVSSGASTIIDRPDQLSLVLS
ncbi:MAG: HAD family hydrolase [Dysgonamonadaceae bacterium]|jgi:phosphoglycolate phosphatase|nr:HAD family hydrolase [Dysgonamonadaceae bacterium]